MRPLLLTLLVLFAPLARAEDGSPSGRAPVALAAPPLAGMDAPSVPPPPPVDATPAARPSDPRFGISLDLGLPEGAAIGVLFRPVPAFRLWGGPAWNYVGWGLQGGVAFVPIRWAISPVLSLEAGRYFDADLTRFVSQGSGAPTEVEPLLRKVGFTYAAALLGFELGSQRGFAFSLRAGISRVSVIAHGSSQTTSSGGTTGSGSADVSFRDPRIVAIIPSVKLGFQLFF